MSLIVVDQAEEIFLDAILAVNMTLRLFKNDISGLTQTQKDALIESGLTEATFTGYSAKTLTGGAWTTTAGNPGVGVYTQQVFASTANQSSTTQYGYYVTRVSDGKLLWLEEFTGGGVAIANDGEGIAVTPRITLKDAVD